VPPSHPYYEIFELWGAVKTDIEMMDRERRRHEAELGEALRQLRESEHRYRAVFEASGAAMVLFGEDRRIRMANEAALRMSGLRRDQMEAGFEWTSLVHPEDLPRLLAYHLARSNDSSLPSQYEARFLDARGKERIASVTVESVPGTSLRVASLNDLTETRRAEAEVMRLARNLEQRVRERTAELEETNRKLADALRTREEFLATMSHELRTPLASILNLAESLTAGVYGTINRPQAKAVGTMASNGKHLLDLITDILDLSKSQAGKLELRRTTIVLSEAVLDAAAMIRPNAQARDLELVVESDRSQDLLQADPRRVRQMIVNLLSNAVKFTAPGHRLGVRSGPSPIPDHLRLEVWDEGIGISEQEQARLFQPFVQLDNRLAREHSGTGLGLSLTRSLVELHGGSIHMESSVGNGSRFFIDLPRGQIDGIEPSDQVSDGHPDDSPGPLRLLIIEDNEDLRTVLADYLEAAGHDVLCADSGPRGLEILQEQDVDTILLDVQMPKMDGYEVLRRIRSRPESAHLPVIAMTGLAFEDDARRCRDAGADLHLAKPLRMAELMRAIRSLQNRNAAP
jgi:PAS domain S-box-containing protein